MRRKLDEHDRLCEVCKLQVALCLCAQVPRLVTRTRVTVLVHHREARKPSNTGQLAARCLVRGAVERVGQSGRLITPPALGDEQPLLLFPDADAEPIEAYAASALPIALFVPDGSWPQARAMRRRGPALASMPCVRLPATAPSEYRLREEPWPGGLATLEAIARALRILEGPQGPALEAALQQIFRVMVERTLWFRGQLVSEQVTGGLPEAALLADPRGTHTRGRAAALDAGGQRMFTAPSGTNM